MRKITVEEVRKALIACDFLLEEESTDMPDDVLEEQNFQEDLEMDSLDFMLLVEKLEDNHDLSRIDVQTWDCHTVGELIELSEK